MENEFFLFNEQKGNENLNSDFKLKLLEEELKKKNLLIEKLTEENNSLKIERTQKDTLIKTLKDELNNTQLFYEEKIKQLKQNNKNNQNRNLTERNQKEQNDNNNEHPFENLLHPINIIKNLFQGNNNENNRNNNNNNNNNNRNNNNNNNNNRNNNNINNNRIINNNNRNNRNNNNRNNNNFEIIMNNIINRPNDNRVLRQLSPLLRNERNNRRVNRIKGLTQSEIDRIPCEIFNSNMNYELRNCTICLENFREGDILKRLGCLHIFHKDCIVPWLKEKNLCPIDKHQVNVNLNG